jgi:O-antigen/teichoic acid export membrane protein
MQLLNVADRYVIQGFAGLQQVGIYSAIYNLSNAGVMVLTNPVLLAFAPRIFQRAGAASSLRSNVDARQLTESSLQLLLIIGSPLLAWSALLHREFVTLVLGAKYAETTIVFPLVVGGILIWQFAQILQKGFETAGQTTALGSSIASAVGVNLLLNFILVPRLGIIGAALATLGAYIWYAVLIAIRVARYGRPRIAFRTVMNVLAATAFSSSLLVLSNRLGGELWMRGASCILCLGIYAGALLLLKESILTTQLRSVQRVLGTR